MPFTPINVVNGSTPANATWGNLVQTQYTEATLSLNQDAASASPFVLSGLACVKDTTTASKLNVGAGVAYLLQSDSTLRRRAPAATNFTTAVVSTTYYLDLNPDGTFSWATSHSGTANYLPIVSVTTDSSGNISGVTDARVFTMKLLTGGVNASVKTPPLQLPAPLQTVLTQSASNVGTVVGGVTFAQTGALAASMDGSALFNGTSGYISLPTGGLPTGAGPWTIEAWVNISAYPSTNGIVIQLGTGSTDHQAQIGMTSTGGITASLWNDDTTASSPLSQNAWHQLVATYDGATLKLYIDGAAPITKATALGNLTYGTATIGASVAGGSYTNFFGGRIDEVAIYGTALSATRITAHYNAATATASDAYATTVLSDAPLRYYRLGDAGGSTVAVCTTTPTPTTLFDAGGTLKSIGGQASVGTLGAPVIVAQAFRVPVTVTTNTTILTYTAPVTGIYRVGGYVRQTNTATTSITCTLSWTDPDTGGGGVTLFMNWEGVTVGSLSRGGGPNYVDLTPSTICVQAGAVITVKWQDSAGSPNDVCSFFIERLI